MNKIEILYEIKKKVPSAKFPDGIDFNLTNTTLFVKLNSKSVIKNMQDTNAAFEGWIFVIRNYFPNINSVILNWESLSYNEKECNETQIQKGHYNRFILRVIWFAENYGWFNIDYIRKKEIESFKESHCDLVVNYPNIRSKDIDNNNGREAVLERQICQILNNRLPDSSNHQLPVGLFDKVKSKRTACTPNQASQIDIWQIDNGIFKIFELKCEENRAVGIISELMFYANVVYRIFIKNKLNIPKKHLS